MCLLLTVHLRLITLQMQHFSISICITTGLCWTCRCSMTQKWLCILLWPEQFFTPSQLLLFGTMPRLQLTITPIIDRSSSCFPQKMFGFFLNRRKCLIRQIKVPNPHDWESEIKSFWAFLEDWLLKSLWLQINFQEITLMIHLSDGSAEMPYWHIGCRSPTRDKRQLRKEKDNRIYHRRSIVN